MNYINRHNYEEYFLLYVDNELTEAQRKQVEMFISENPDLAPELDLLNGVKLEPVNDTVYDDKMNLYKHAEEENMLHNYEYWFLLYVDNELTPDQRQQVEKLVLQNPEIQPAFSAIKQSVLQPEAVIHPDKSSLYKKESIKILPLFTRFAAAAVFISVVLFSWWYAENEEVRLTSKVSPTVEIQKQQPELAKNNKLQPLTGETVTENKAEEKLPTISKEKSVSLQRREKEHTKPVNVPAQETKKRFADEEFLIAENKPTFLKSENTMVPEPKINEKSKPADTHSFAASDAENAQPAYKIMTAGYKEINTSDDDQSLYVAGLNLNKNKVKGFLKKAENILSNKTKEYIKGDGKLQVANLEFEDNK